jgi:hypothetical protein
VALLGGGRTFKGLVGGPVVTGGVALKGILGPQALPFPLTYSQEVNGFAMSYAHCHKVGAPHTGGLKAIDPPDHILTPPKTVTQNKSFLFISK